MDKFMIVKDAIDNWDPLGLLNMGCPDDEYEGEIEDIVDRLSTIKSVDVLAIEIHKVFTKWFWDGVTTVENCYPPAQQIWDKLK